MKKSFFDIDEVGKVYLWCLIMPQILVFFAQILLMLIGSAIGSTSEDLLKITPVFISYLMLAQIAFLLIYLIFTKKVDTKSTLKFNKISFLSIVICVLIGVIGLFGISPLSNAFSNFLQFLGLKTSGEFFFEMGNPFMLIISIILIAGVPAVIEELIFRGIIFQGLRKYGNTCAIVLTSLLFAIVHLSVEQLIFPFIFSTILCLIVLKTKSIFSAMIIHFVSNAISIICYYFNFSLVFNLPVVWYILCVIGICLIAYTLILFLIKLLKNSEKEKKPEEILNFIDNNEENITTYNSSTYTLKLAIYLGIALWVLNLLVKIFVI